MKKKLIIVISILAAIILTSTITIIAINNDTKTKENNIIQEEKIISESASFTSYMRKGAFKVREINSLSEGNEKVMLEYEMSHKTKDGVILDFYTDGHGGEYVYSYQKNYMSSYTNYDKRIYEEYFESKTEDIKSKEEIGQIADKYFNKFLGGNKEYEITQFSNDGHENYYEIRYYKKISGYKVGYSLSLDINILGELCGASFPYEDERLGTIKEISIDEEKLYKHIEENMQTDYYDEYKIMDEYVHFGFNKEGIFEAEYGLEFKKYVEFDGNKEEIISASLIQIPYDAIKKDNN